MIGDLLFGAAVLLTGAILLVWHVAEWRSAQRRTLDPGDLAFGRRRFRRRVETSSLILLLGVAVLFGSAFDVLNVFYWAAVLLVLLGIVLLAGADVLALHCHYGRKQHGDRVQLARLLLLLRRSSREPRTNGEPRDQNPRPVDEA